MRLRITRQLHDRIDGIHFSSYRQGYVYDVGSTIGNYLLAVGAAEPVDDGEPTIVLPPERHLFHPGGPPTQYGKLAELDRKPDAPQALAADRRRTTGTSRRLRAGSGRTAAPLVDVRVRVAALAQEVERLKRHLANLAPAI